MHRAIVVAAVAALAARPAHADDARWVIEPAPEGEGAIAAGADRVARAQKLARGKKYLEAVQLLEAVAREHPAAEHDCNLSLAYLRAGALTRAQLLWDVAGLRNTARPTWCTGNLATQLATALRASGFVPLTITIVPADAIVETGGVAMRGLNVLWLPPGSHTVGASAPGHVAERVDVALAAPNGRVTISLEAERTETVPDVVEPPPDEPDLPPPDDVVEPPLGPEPVDARPVPPPRPVQWPAYAAAAVAGVSLGVGIYFHVDALDATEEGNRLFRSDPAFADAEDRFERGRAGALISYAIAGVAAGFATWWYLDHRVTVGAAPAEGGAVLTARWSR